VVFLLPAEEILGFLKFRAKCPNQDPMPSFYFLWNPTESRPGLSEELGKAARLLADGKRPREWNWSTGSRTKTNFPPGSRFFMVRTGKKPRGVIGYGTLPTGELYHSDHWDSRNDGQDATYVDIDFENLIDSEQDPQKVVSLEFLKAAGFGFQVWSPLSNGTKIPDEAADQIKARFDGPSAPTIEELLELDPQLGTQDLAGPEGRILIKTHLVRERNQALVKKKKEAVLSTTGALACEVCRFDFLETYGELGRGFAECHHLNPLALLAKTIETKLEDLAIVCANCHRMLHRGKLWKTIAQLKDILLASPKPRR
jgi:HNH endonuclease